MLAVIGRRRANFTFLHTHLARTCTQAYAFTYARALTHEASEA